MFPPELPLTTGQVGTLVLLTDATLSIAVWKLWRVVNSERALARQFRQGLMKAVGKSAGFESAALAIAQPIGEAIAKRILTPRPPKPAAATQVMVTNGKQEGQEEGKDDGPDGVPEGEGDGQEAFVQ